MTIGPHGTLVSVTADGHAGKGVRGSDIVCAAVTVLLRTTMQALAEHAGPQLVAETSGRGSLSFRVSEWKEADVPLLRYAALFLRSGLTSLQEEYPDAVSLRVEQS